MDQSTMHHALVVLLGSMAGFGRLRGPSPNDMGVHPNFVTGITSPLAANTNGTITITVDRAGTTPTEIFLSSSDTTQMTVPSSVTIPANQTQVQATVSAPSTANGSGGTITASANGQQAQLQVGPP